jgi:hypothetical protein
VDKREAVWEELQELRRDLRDLVVTLTTDQKELERRRRNWRILEAVTGAVFLALARRVATKGWGILTGEVPPYQIPSEAPSQQRESDREPVGSRDS